MTNKDNNYTIVIDEKAEVGVYANAVSVQMNNNECIVDMAYLLPNKNKTTLKVVSRINMSHKTAKSFLNILSNAVLDWENKKKK